MLKDIFIVIGVANLLLLGISIIGYINSKKYRRRSSRELIAEERGKRARAAREELDSNKPRLKVISGRK